MTDFFDHLPEFEIVEGPARPAQARQTFPCESCGGKGKVAKVYGYTPMTQRTYMNTCPVCKGKGHFFTSYADRQKSQAQAAAAKIRKATAAREDFDAANPGVREFLMGAMKWSSFAASLFESLTKYHDLTEKQLAAAQSMMEKTKARDAERNAQRAANTMTLDASNILGMFATAKANGLNRRALLAGGTEGKLKVTPSSDTSRNAGGLWVTVDDEFVGGISKAGEFQPRNNTPAWAKDALLRMTADPAGEARLYGQRTGVCCCCGRELTDPVSIEAGIGPICAERWGL